MAGASGAESKTFGTCPLCDEHDRLTEQHVRLVPELNGLRIMICRSCHDVVSRYEDEVEKIRKHLRAHPAAGQP